MTRAAPSGSENRANIPELDGVRGLAILFVFLFHCMPASGFRYVDAVLQLRGSLWIGVDLFFVLSGFLISGVLLDHHASRNRYRAFYVRRTLRIFDMVDKSGIAERDVVTQLEQDKAKFTFRSGWRYSGRGESMELQVAIRRGGQFVVVQSAACRQSRLAVTVHE